MLTRTIRRLAARAGVIVSSALVAPALAAAQPVLIDFAGYRSAASTSYQAVIGGDMYTQGFVFTATGFGLNTYGTDPADPFAEQLPSNLGATSATLYTDTFGESVDMRRWTDPATDVNTSGGFFNLRSMDVAHLYRSSFLTTPPDGSPASLSVINFYVLGWTSADGLGTATRQALFTLPVPPTVGGVQVPLLYTLVMPSDWVGLSRVRFWNGSATLNASGQVTAIASGSAVSSQFTNLAVEIVPEPSTYLLVAAGGFGLVAVARRRVRGAAA